MNVRNVLAVAGLFFIATIAASSVDVIRKPEVGTDGSAGPGEVMYSETLVKTGESTSEVAVLLQETAPVEKGPVLASGTELVFVMPQVESPMHYSGAVPGVRAACVANAFQVGTLGGAKKYLCFQDINNDGR